MTVSLLQLCKCLKQIWDVCFRSVSNRYCLLIQVIEGVVANTQHLFNQSPKRLIYRLEFDWSVSVSVWTNSVIDVIDIRCAFLNRNLASFNHIPKQIHHSGDRTHTSDTESHSIYIKNENEIQWFITFKLESTSLRRAKGEPHIDRSQLTVDLLNKLHKLNVVYQNVLKAAFSSTGHNCCSCEQRIRSMKLWENRWSSSIEPRSTKSVGLKSVLEIDFVEKCISPALFD